MASNQRRCVFVGNIPYDATEEQLVQICEEVGPVVSFRLVIDRETGKPKGYGFCEYKDEETALSARRNLQGYEINGRQLRVDFAENDKTSDRSREQGRGGPGLPSGADFQKPFGGPSVPADSTRYQPIGLHSAINAAAVVAGALGAAPANGLPGQSAAVSDPLTLHLAKLSRTQLTDVLSEVKTMATQNMESARQLLLAKPQLAKALFQSQIMLGLVTPEMLQTVSSRQGLGQFPQHSMQDSRQAQLPAGQSHPGLPPLAQTNMQSGMKPKIPEGQLPQSSLVHSQFFTSQQPTMQPQIPIQRDANNQILQPSLPINSGIPVAPSTSLPFRPQTQVVHSSSVNLPMMPPLQQLGQFTSASIGLSRQGVAPSSVIQTSQSADDATWARRGDAQSSIPSRFPDKNMASDFSDQFNHPSKMLKMGDGTSASFTKGSSNVPVAAGPGPSNVSGVGTLPNPANKTEDGQFSDKPISQVAPEVETALLQQVLNLTPEQLSLLPPDQKQQVLQLQQALQQGQLKPS